MWKSKNEEVYTISDLRQENDTLRSELSLLYETMLTSESNTHIRHSVIATQADIELSFCIPDVAERIKSLANELSYQRSLNVEQANRAKETERKIRDCESAE